MSEERIKLTMADDPQAGSCCGEEESVSDYGNAAEADWVTGQVETSAGPVCRIATTLKHRDLLGSFKARWGVGRMSYTVPPGLYAVGNPDQSSPVLVSANYKLSFDSLRRELSGLNLWILVIDTKGINVWCAAGKGTFGTEEVVRMVNATRLPELVTNKTLVLPQLSAPGVTAFEVRRRCGFRVIFGPVRAADIPAFLKAGSRAEPEMRRTYFGLLDRLVLTPVELTALAKPLAYFTLFLLLLNLANILLAGGSFQPAYLISQTFINLVPFLGAVLVGAVFVPAFLPYLPGRALSWKGLVLGLVWAGIYTGLYGSGTSLLAIISYFLIIPAVAAFLSINFTGSTTYTSLSGVVKEMKLALPLIIAAAGLGLIALTISYFV